MTDAANAINAAVAAQNQAASESTSEVDTIAHENPTAASAPVSGVTTLRIFLVFVPLYYFDPLRLGLATACGLLTFIACCASYRMTGTLKLFGITWCDPAKGSEWEEFFIGLLPWGTAFIVAGA